MILNIVGGGRWAIEIAREASKISEISKILIFSGNKNINFKKIERKFYKVELKEKEKININKLENVIIANSVEKHFSNAIRFLKLGCYVLVEKPIFKNFVNIKEIFPYKKKLFISKVFSFDNEISDFIKSKKKNLKKIKIIWYDKKYEIRRGYKKNHNQNISFHFDVLHHIINLVEIIKSERNVLKYFNKITKINDENNYSHIVCSSKNLEIEYILSRDKKIRKRLLELHTKNKVFFLNFGKKKIQKNISKFSYKNENSNLRNMIKYFILKKKEYPNYLRFDQSQDYVKIYRKIFN